jgi:chloramphenicol 3-O phosphotransferase
MLLNFPQTDGWPYDSNVELWKAITSHSMESGKRSESSRGRVVLFNGPPSSGKTSLVNSLLALISEPWFHLSLDDFRRGYSEQWWVLDRGQLFDRVLAGYLASLREMAIAGNDVLAEAVITPSRQALYAATFGDLPIALIGVHCALKVAVQRERNRTDRRRGPIDLPLEEYEAVHTGLTYDFEIDTSDERPEDLARAVALNFRSLSSSAFASHTS